jgi:glucose-1-phosphate cytidylyltransferase
MMKAVILAGGMGTRMREETEYRPKPMVDIGGFPVLWHIMKNFSQHNIKDFIVCLGYKGEQIVDYFFKDSIADIKTDQEGLKTYSGTFENWRVTLIETGLVTQTGGRLLKIKNHVIENDFLCTYGDGLAGVNVTELIDFHKRNRRVATVTAVQPVSRFGLLEISETDQVLSFVEKPKLNEWVNGGYFCFSPELFNYISDDSPLEIKPLTKLADANELAAFKHHGFWQPMDTYREYVELNQMWIEKNAYWKTWND